MKDSISIARAKSLLQQVLPSEDVSGWGADAALLGAVPDFDSMTMVALITLIEDAEGIVVEDADLSAEDFSTLGAFSQWLEQLLS